MINVIRKYHLLFLLLFILFIFFILKTYKDYGISWDEQFYLAYGKNYIDYFFKRPILAQKIDPLHGLSHGAFFDILYVFILRMFHADTNFAVLHLVKALVSSMTLIFVYLSIFVITKKRKIALAGAILMIFFPRWTGDMFDNHMDSVATLLYAIELYLALKILQLRANKYFKIHIIIFAIISAIAFSHRMILFFIPLILFSLLYLKEKNKTRMLKTFLVVFLPVFSAIYILVTPSFGLYGLSGFLKQIIYLFRYQWHNTNLFDGAYILAKHLPWYYLPKWIVITTPLIILAFAFIGVIGMIGRINKANILIILSLILPLAAVSILRPVIYDGWRLFLFLSVPLVIIASMGFETLLQNKPALIKYLAVFLLVLNIFTTSREMMNLHPYEFIFFNSLVGGLKGANGKYDTEYWGKSYKEAVVWLKKNEIKKEKNYSIFSCDNTFSSEYYFSKNMKLVKNVKEADYAVCYTRWNGDKNIPGKTIYIVSREGVRLNVVKKVR